MTITKDIRYIGVNDHAVDLFEGQYVVPGGMCYNSYAIVDEKVAIMDTVDRGFTHQWLDNIQNTLGGRKPDYLVVQHMEPDHSANIANFLKVYPEATVVSSAKAFVMMKNFFGDDYADRRIVVGEGDTLCLGKHTLTFVGAPMVHWPEVIVTYDSYDKVLFSADGFGKFGALDVEEDWADEARRYYIGIVGKYGAQVQALLKKAAGLDISIICPLHGPVLTENLGYYLNLYDIWSSYRVESDGIVVAYTSVYGHTKAAAELLAQKLADKGCPKVVVHDLARCDMSKAVEDAFRYGKLVLATTTYNADVFPFMKEFIHHLTERNFQNRTIGLMENGSWAPTAAGLMRAEFQKLKNCTILDEGLTIKSSLKEAQLSQMDVLAQAIYDSMDHPAPAVHEDAKPIEQNAMFSLSYGLYVLTARDGEKDNGCIINTVMQQTDTPKRISITVNKANYTCDMIKKTGVFNVSVLSQDAPFAMFQHYGFQSGRDVDKFADAKTTPRAINGVCYVPACTKAFLSGKVIQTIEFETHILFIADVTEARELSNVPAMTYSYYFENVKPKPAALAEQKGWVCKICGYVYEGETLPADFICPLCKHGAEDFEKLG